MQRHNMDKLTEFCTAQGSGIYSKQYDFTWLTIDSYLQ